MNNQEVENLIEEAVGAKSTEQLDESAGDLKRFKTALVSMSDDINKHRKALEELLDMYDNTLEEVEDEADDSSDPKYSKELKKLYKAFSSESKHFRKSFQLKIISFRGLHIENFLQ